ncbi:MAG: hypothetical protein H6Q09_221 [Acidobacteria bacterium]|jgi:hypothetical protein|nr:hypothetical protein [Acidobacteriota bacterium]
MGRLLRLIVIAAVLWAAWHAGLAAWQQFQFNDEVEKIAQFGPDKDAGSVMAAVLDAARRLNLPVTEKDVRIRQESQPTRLNIDVSYTVQIEVLPRFFYPWTFTSSARGLFFPGGRAPLK